MVSPSRILIDTLSRLQHQLRQHGDAIATSIVLEQGKTFAGLSFMLLSLIALAHTFM